MIVRTLDDVREDGDEVHEKTWGSRRLLLKRHGMGFSLHDTAIHAGTSTAMWYKNHLEAVYCIDGTGEIEDSATGAVHRIRPGTVYALDRHDRHVLRAETDMRLICVFTPPCVGRETHDADGAYPLLEEPAAGE